MSAVDSVMQTLLDLVKQIESQRDDAICEAARLAKANGDQCDEIDELRRRVTELEEQLEQWQRGLRTRLGAA